MFFKQEKGYGFISPDNGGTDVFVPVSAIDGGLLRDGQKVSYDVGQDRKTGETRAENFRVCPSRPITRQSSPALQSDLHQFSVSRTWRCKASLAAARHRLPEVSVSGRPCQSVIHPPAPVTTGTSAQ